MVVKYTIDRASLYNGKYENANMQILSGNIDDRIKLKTHLAVIYRLLKIIRKREYKNDNKKTEETKQSKKSA